MRVAAIALASLLFACTAADENAAANEDGGADVEMNGGGDGSALPESGNPATPPAGTPPVQPPSNGDERPDPSSEVSLRASPLQLDAGETVTLTLSNGTSGRLGYNLCTSALQTASGGEVRTDRVCTLELRTLEPGRSASYPYELPVSLESGSYRLSTGIERLDGGARTTTTSNTFTVQ